MIIPIYIKTLPTSFTHIQVQRDIGDGWVDITAATAMAPEIYGENEQLFALDGKDLLYKVNNSWYEIEFGPDDPWTAAGVAAQFTADNLTASVSGGKLYLVHDVAGLGSVLQIGGGEANASLGLEVGAYYGKAAHIELTDENHYFFEDPHGSTSYSYRYRFIGSGVGDWVELDVSDCDVEGDVALCYIRAVDLDTSMLLDTFVQVTGVRSTDNIFDDTNYLAGRVKTFSIIDGYGHIYLPKGETFDIVVDGTGLVRRVNIPDEPIVDLISPSISDGDLFEVQTFDIPSAIRRS